MGYWLNTEQERWTALPWENWFAWYPVITTIYAKLVWLRVIQRRWVIPPADMNRKPHREYRVLPSGVAKW